MTYIHPIYGSNSCITSIYITKSYNFGHFSFNLKKHCPTAIDFVVSYIKLYSIFLQLFDVVIVGGIIQVGPRKSIDRQHFPPNNIIHVLGGAGFLWLGWSGFNGGSPFAANLITSLAILNTHLCTATSLFVWVSMDLVLYKKSSVIGAVQGMITGLVCITPGAGLFINFHKIYILYIFLLNKK